MLVFGPNPETLPVTIQRDATTGLPLLREQGAIMQVILAYLALPYSVTEYGCGKKASLIIDQLLAMDIPPYAIARGMVLERDMSPASIKETDFEKRQHALIADNPLYQMGDTSDSRLRDMLEQNCPEVKLIDKQCVQVGSYNLRHAPQVQFVTARSHIYTTVTFWDKKNACAAERVIDPSLYRSEFFAVEKVRDLLYAPEALIFEAPLLARFRLDQNRLTEKQRKKVQELIKDDRPLDDLSYTEHADLVRKLTGAQAGTLGDPDTWTYANNIKVAEDGKRRQGTLNEQEHNTGRGDALVDARCRLLVARKNRTGDASAIRAELRDIIEAIDVHRIAIADAVWSAKQLEPLADAAMIFVYYNSLCALAEMIQSDEDVLQHLQSPRELQPLRGLGVRLRRRIDWLGRVSKEADGRIDARALSPGFVSATIETIKQMNTAGLTVFVDRVGNIHGLLLDDASREAVSSGNKKPADYTRAAIAHCSHIDTVNDAGKFDGRLGVLAGVETTHVLTDLERYFDIPVEGSDTGVYTCVSAFIGEEMTFTGQGVSMPGSAAVSGRAEPERIHEMRNGNGERFGDCLTAMLRELKQCQSSGKIELINDFAGTDDDEALIRACSDPGNFYTPHTFERHIEQGPFLDRANVPLVMVGTIMGIYQEDFFFKGERAEAAALELNRRMRLLTSEERFTDVRITVGILEGCGENRSIENVYPALRWTLNGDMNHAGATPTKDRRDPGVAAARMAREFLDWYDRTLASENAADLSGLRPVVSNVRLLPGTNRNVIPASVSMTVALAGNDDDARELVDELVREDLSQTLEGFAVGTLARQVAGGGEGVRLCRVEPVSYTNIYSEARLSIDLRADEQAISDDFRQRTGKIIEQIRKEYEVDVSGELQQKLPPFNLENSGQALLMERSYGGSHNPREVELLSDIVRGCILQIAVTREVLALDDLQGFSLFKCVESHMPEAWLNRMARFTSGALHDTCNIAARTLNLD